MPLTGSLQLSSLVQGMSRGSPWERGTGQGELGVAAPLFTHHTLCKHSSSLPELHKDSLQECGWSEPAIQQGEREVRGTARKNTKYLQKIFSQSTRQTLSPNKLHSCKHKDQGLQIKSCFCKTNPKTSNLLKKQNQSVLFPHAAAAAQPEGRAQQQGWRCHCSPCRQGGERGHSCTSPTSPDPLLVLVLFPAAPSGIVLSTAQPQDLQQCPAMPGTADATTASIWRLHKARNFGKHQHSLQQCVSLYPPTPSPSEDGQ